MSTFLEYVKQAGKNAKWAWNNPDETLNRMGQKVDIFNAKVSNEGYLKIKWKQFKYSFDNTLRDAGDNINSFFANWIPGQKEKERDAFCQQAAMMFVDLYDGSIDLANRSGRALIVGARTLGKKIKEFWERLGELAQTCKDYVTERGQQAINSARESINSIAQMLNDISRGRGGEARQR